MQDGAVTHSGHAPVRALSGKLRYNAAAHMGNLWNAKLKYKSLHFSLKTYHLTQARMQSTLGIHNPAVANPMKNY